MEFLHFLLKNWVLTTVFIVSGILLFMWPMIQRRFSPTKGASTLEATRLINAGSIIVLDVRSEADYQAGHLNRAINIPLGQLKTRLNELEKKSAKNILVYCDRGHRSLAAARMLTPLGKAVHNLQGGIIAWQEANLPVERGTEKTETKAPEKKNNGKNNGKKFAKKKAGKDKKTAQVDDVKMKEQSVDEMKATDKTSDQQAPESTVATAEDFSSGETQIQEQTQETK